MFLAQGSAAATKLLNNPEAIGIGAVAVVAIVVLNNVIKFLMMKLSDKKTGQICAIDPAKINAQLEATRGIKTLVEKQSEATQAIASNSATVAQCLQELKNGRQADHDLLVEHHAAVRAKEGL